MAIGKGSKTEGNRTANSCRRWFEKRKNKLVRIVQRLKKKRRVVGKIERQKEKQEKLNLESKFGKRARSFICE